MSFFDAIVLGCGGVGSAAMYHLARRGLRVLGLERFHPVHNRGSSHGATRIIRQAYFEHPDYVPLLSAAYDLWERLEIECGHALYRRTGLIQVGPADGEVVPGVVRSAAEHGLPVERLTAAEAESRFSGLRVPGEMATVFEPRAGYLRVERCVAAHLAGAVAAGARLRCGVTVRGWQPKQGDIEVVTDQEVLRCARLVIAAGPWAATLLGELHIPLEVQRRDQLWLVNADRRYEASAGFPAYLFELPGGVFYGFPQIDARGVKVAEHSGSVRVADPLAYSREPDPEACRRLTTFVEAHLPGVSRAMAAHEACLYTLTPDGHFVVDRHPALPQVVFAAGLSGHGFKFAAVLGQVLADLAVDGSTALPIGFLGLRRPALTAGG